MRECGVRRVLVIQGDLNPWSGGGAAVAAWILEALRGRYEIWLVAWHPADFAKVNEVWGTRLTADDVKVKIAYRMMRRIMDAIPLPLAHLRLHLLFRAAIKMQRQFKFDLTISCQNEGAFGPGGIQYVHFPWGFYPRPDHDMRWYHFSPPLRKYRKFCERLSGYSKKAMLQNLTLTNSDWTNRKFLETYGVSGQTLTPPIPGGNGGAGAAWAEREDAFIVLGRLSPEKQIEKVIGILSAARHRMGRDLKLHIVGSTANTSYASKIGQIAKQEGDWISFTGNVGESEKAEIVGRCRYGIHGMEHEHFGIAVAELQRGGCIVFVPEDGGPAEIVGGITQLLYRSPEDAVEKVCALLDNTNLQDEIRRHLSARRDIYTAERFVREFRAAADRVSETGSMP